MKIVLIAANERSANCFKRHSRAPVIDSQVGRKSGDLQVDIENRESIRRLYQASHVDAVAIAAASRIRSALELTAKSGSFVWKQAHGPYQSGSGGDAFINEGIIHLVSGVLNDEPIFASAAAARVGALKFARLPRRTSQGLRNQCGESDDPEGIEAQIWSVLFRRNSRRRRRVAQAYKRAILGCKRPRLQSRLSLPASIRRPSGTSQEPGLAKESTCFIAQVRRLTYHLLPLVLSNL